MFDDMSDFFKIYFGFLLLIFIVALADGLEVPPFDDGPKSFCEENDMVFHWGYNEAFNYCIESDGKAHKIVQLGNEWIFVKETDEELEKEGEERMNDFSFYLVWFGLHPKFSSGTQLVYFFSENWNWISAFISRSHVV